MRRVDGGNLIVENVVMDSDHATPRHSKTKPIAVPSSIVWLLRCAVALQAFGIGWKYLFGEYEIDSAIRSVLFYEWQWPETVAQRVDDVGAWMYFVSGLLVLVAPLVACLISDFRFRISDSLVAWALRIRARRWWLWGVWQGLPLVVILVGEVLLVTAAWHRDDALLASWSPWESHPQISIPLILFGRASRILLPLILLLWTWPSSAQGKALGGHVTSAVWLMRFAVSATFLAHGIECLLLSAEFVDYLLAAAHNLIGWDADESTMHVVLRVIGLIDLLIALLVLSTRWRWVPLYMACWALVAAFSRIVEYGWMSHFDVTVRSANYCIPLALCLYYYRCRSEIRTTDLPPDQAPPTRSP